MYDLAPPQAPTTSPKPQFPHLEARPRPWALLRQRGNAGYHPDNEHASQQARTDTRLRHESKHEKQNADERAQEARKRAEELIESFKSKPRHAAARKQGSRR